MQGDFNVSLPFQNKTSRKMLRKEKTVFAVAFSGMGRGDVAAATES
jgi:hypothetical protein